MRELKRTVLYDAHVALGATMVDFGGWDMPIQYPTGIITEHMSTRRRCGIFDVSHMGRLVVEGPERVAFLQKVLSSNVTALVPGRAQYCMIPNEQGGAADDAYLYMFEEDRYLLIVNASNTDKDLEHFAATLPGYDCTVTNVTAKTASIAIQGPDSDQILKQLSGSDIIADPKKNSLNVLQMEGHTVWLSRTGYTGEPIGYELFVTADEAHWLWNRLLELGAVPNALGARDTLRLEAGLPLYGHEMGADPSGAEIPVFAVPLARFAVSFAEEKGDFIGKAILSAQKAALEAVRSGDLSGLSTLPKRIVPIQLTDRGVIRAGMDIYQGGSHIGWVTSGTMVPYCEFDENGLPTDKTGKRSIGFAYLSSDVSAGDAVEIDIRGKRVKAAVVARHARQDQPPYLRPIL